MRFVLIHSPLVGDTTWQAVAKVLRQYGHEVMVPSLVPALEKGPHFSAEFARIVSAEAPAGCWLVGHSGAGPLLASIAQLCSAAGLVFVDAGLPHPGLTRLQALPRELADQLEELADEGGMLPPWPEWFGREALSDLISSDELLDRFVDDCPPLPMSMFTEPMPHADWSSLPGAYLRLSDAYEKDSSEAERRGWPVLLLDGHHLWPVDHPAEVAEAILSLLE